MAELVGELYGEAPGARLFHVGVFPGPRVHGQPAAWTTLVSPGRFRLEVPQGTWYIHAVGGPADEMGFLSGTTWGSHGGIYGFGRPVTVGEGEAEPVRIHLSHLWRDLTHLPALGQPALSDEQWRSVDRALNTLQTDLSSAVGGDLDRSASMARTRLSALFKRGTGLTMEEYRIRLRLEAAKALLVETDSDILNIALEVGYATQAQLGRMFQRYLGVSPGEFRRLAQAVRAAAPESPTGRAAARRSGGLGAWLPFLGRRGSRVSGEVLYRGSAREGIIYVGLFPRALPDTYPVTWCALPEPGPFTLRGAPTGRFYVLAAYCRRRMRWPGDVYAAFAYGGYGDVDTTGALTGWDPVPLELREGDSVGGITVEMVDGDIIARFARPWTQIFLPDGR